MLKADGFRRWYLVHKWTSLICTVFLLLLCLTGLPLIFRDEIALWLGDLVEPSEQTVASSDASVDLLVEAARARRPGEFIKFLTREPDVPVWVVSLGLATSASENSSAFLFDAHSGQLLLDLPVRQGLLYILLKLHVDLFQGLPGTLFLGVMGFLFVISTVSGVVVYGPFMRKLPFGAIRREGITRLAWLDVHNLLGIVTVVWVLVVGSTGVINTLARPLLAVWQRTELAQMTAPWRGQPDPAAIVSAQSALDVARSAEPDLEVRLIAFPGTSFAGKHHYTIFMRGKTDVTQRLFKPVLVEAASGGLTGSRDLPWYLTLLLLSRPLHFGDYGGLPLKVLWTVLDLITIVVLLSGLYLWWKKRTLSGEQILAESELTPPGKTPSRQEMTA